jgi:hypothetical protein
MGKPSFSIIAILLLFSTSVILYGQTAEVLPANAVDATLKIIKLTTDGDDIFDFAVNGPTSYNPSIDTSNGFTGEVVVYHTFDFNEIDESDTLLNLYVNSGTYGHNADAHGLLSRYHDSLTSESGIIGESLFLDFASNAILGNWINQDQWNFLVDDQTSQYSINFWIKGDFSFSSAGGTSILSTLNGEGFGFDLYIDEERRPVILIYNNGKLVQTVSSSTILENDNWQMVTFVIDKSQEFDTATIWVNATSPVSQDRSAEFEFEPLEYPPDFIDQPLVIGDFNADRVDYSAQENDFFIDDLCIVKDYVFSQSNLDELYNDGDGSPCADITGTGTSITDVPVLSLFDDLSILIDTSDFSNDFVIGNRLDLNTNVTVTKVRLWVNDTNLLSQGTLQAVVLSNITEEITQSGQEVVEAISDSIDFSDPKFSAENYFVTFNFTTVANYSSTDILVGINGTGLDGNLILGTFLGQIGGGTESICADLSNPAFVWNDCSTVSNIDNLMFEVNIKGNGTTQGGPGIQNREIDSVNLQGDGGMGVDGPVPVDSGTYSISETIPSNWSLTGATCNDGFSSFSVDTISGIVIDPGDNIECTFENEFVFTQDSDGDGILDNVDTLPFTVSDDFSDIGLGGTTSGTITTRGDQILTISEVTGPDGVRISADVSGGLLPAVVDACGGISIITINSGDEVVVTCGNLTIETASGTVDISFTLSGAIQAETSLAQVNSITFDQDTFTFSAPPTNTLTITIDVQGTSIELAPGSSFSFGLLTISKTTTGGNDTFDLTVAGPSTYNPSINTVGGDANIVTNEGTAGSAGDAVYYEYESPSNFIPTSGIINEGVIKNGTSSLQTNGEIYLGTTASTWDFLHKAGVGSALVSINFWLNGDVDGGVKYPMLSNYNSCSATVGGFQVYTDSTQTLVHIHENSILVGVADMATIPADDSQWHMVTVTYDKSITSGNPNIQICIDGTCEQDNQFVNNWTGLGASADDILTIGSDADHNCGVIQNTLDIDDVTIWNGYLLTPTDISNLYNAGAGASAGSSGLGISLANQVGHWSFDDISSSGMGVDGPVAVGSGTYSISETIPSNWSLTGATCNDGFSSFSVDTISGIVIDPGDNIECIFENEFVGTSDTDGDGILDDVDTLPNTISDDFSDTGLGGTTSGTITTRGDQILTISEEANPNGVRIVADNSGGLLPALGDACAGISLITMTPGDNIVVTCGSVTIDVTNGPVEVTFIGSEGTQATSTLPAGNSITFDHDTFSFSTPSTNDDPVVVIVDGEQIIINPGNAASVIPSSKDGFIKLGESNTNEGANTMMRVRDNGNNRALILFDQGDILSAAQDSTLASATLRLYIEHNGNNWGPEGRTIDIHRILEDWSEGDGFNDKPASMSSSEFNSLKTRGSGAGVTWKCAIDSEIQNQQTDCSTHWDGATYSSIPTDTVTIFKDNPPTGTVKTVGWIEFDVTDDLQAFLGSTEQNFGWIIRKTNEGDPGLVEFSSGESGANMPELVLVFE